MTRISVDSRVARGIVRRLASVGRRSIGTIWFIPRLGMILTALAMPGLAQDGSRSESNYVKLLKKAPPERVGQIVEIIGKRGSSDDLAVVYDRAICPDVLGVSIRLKAIEVLTDAAMTRGLTPKVDLGGLGRLIKSSEPNLKLAAIRLAGAWKSEPIVAELVAIAGESATFGPVRAAAFDALATIGGPSVLQEITKLSTADSLPSVRALAVAALARFDLDAAANQAVAALTDDAKIEDVTPLLAAFLDRQGGGNKLAAVLRSRKPTADGARLALRAVYALGRSDDALIAILSEAAGLEAEPKLPTKEQMDTLVVEVAAKGNAERGEAIFRRAELNCMKCHAVSGAGGGVGPDLSALGVSSPVDYIVNSILIPDQAIKEEFQTRLVLTDDGRVLQGILVEEDDKRLVLKDATGERRVVPIASIEDSKKGGSLMPKGLSTLLTRAEFVDLVRFLSELGKPGPYAIRPTPTIQRWRVLRSDPGNIAGVLQADPGQWSAAYGQVAGTLPMGDVVAATVEKLAYLQGEIAVSTAGPITFRLNSASGLKAWLDDQPLAVGDAPTVEVADGKHKLTLQVDALARESIPIRVEVVKPAGSSAEFSVVGGR